MATRQQKADDDARFQSHCGSMFVAQIFCASSAGCPFAINTPSWPAW